MNSSAQKRIDEIRKRLKILAPLDAHWINVEIRINGEDRRLEADKFFKEDVPWLIGRAAAGI